MGDGVLCLETDDAPLRERFEQLFSDCAVAEAEGLVRLVCHVRAGGDGVDVLFDDPEALDVARFAEALYPGRVPPVECSADGRRLRASPDVAWRPFVANLAVSRLQRLQRHVMFFHAGSLAVGGRGVLACGPKRSGKTTLATAVAARGHSLLGDELAAVRLDARELLPVPRSVAVREGPAAQRVREALAELRPRTEVFPDGERRARAPIGQLFPGAVGAPVPLTSVLLLRTFAATAAAEAAAVAPTLLRHLTPLAASLWNRSPGAIVLQLTRLLAAARVWWIDVGPPDETAQLVERLVETP